MAKVALNIKSLSELQQIQFCVDVKTAMTGNANFTTPVPTLSAFGTLITAAQTAMTAHENAQTAAKQATVNKVTNMTALLAGLSQLATYVDLTANGDQAKILSAGMNVKAVGTPAGVPDQVANLSITSSESEGALDLQWDRLPGAKSYEVQLSPDPMTSTSWGSKPSVTKSQTTVTGLTSGARMWARVRAIASAGPGAWSDPATKVVP